MQSGFTEREVWCIGAITTGFEQDSNQIVDAEAIIVS